MWSGTGIPEDLLISQVQAVSPQQAKKLVTLMVEQGALQQQTVKTVQCTMVPAIFGLSESAQDEVSLHNHYVQKLCLTLYRTCNVCLGSVHDRQCLQTVSDVANALVMRFFC